MPAPWRPIGTPSTTMPTDPSIAEEKLFVPIPRIAIPAPRGLLLPWNEKFGVVV